MADITSETVNFLRFVAFLFDIGTETVLKVFCYCQHKDPSIITFPIHIPSSVATQLQGVLPKHVYYKVKKVQNPEELDLSNLITLVISLFSPRVLRCPVQGWRIKPNSSDNSTTADLLRLRNIRNEIVAHRNRASLSNDDFDTYWKELEDSLTRIYKFIQAGNVQEFEDRVETYRHMIIDATNAEALKNKIIELQSELQDFTKLLKTNHGPYFRYIKLLLEGGRCCLLAYLNTLIPKQDKSLSIVLSDNRTLLLKELGNNHKLMNQIYPDDDQMPINTETKKWDLFVLAVVIISVFGNSTKERRNLSKVEAIRDLRLNYAYTAVYAMNNDQRFIDDREDLVSCLNALSESIGGETEREYIRLKKEYRTIDPTDADVYINQLKAQDLGFTSINDVHRENLEQLKAELKVKGSVDINLNDKYELEIIILLICDDKTKEAEAEHAVHEYMKALLAKPEGLAETSPGYPEVQKTIETINGIPSAKVTCVQKSCLLLTIECRSKQALLSLINYVDSAEFQQHLDNIAIEVTSRFDECFILQGHFTVESLHRVLTNQETSQPCTDCRFSLPISCSTTEGMRQVLELFENGQTTNGFNRMAEGISRQVNAKVALNVSIHAKKLHDN